MTGVGASADAWNTLGIAHAQMGDRAAARRALDTAIALAPAAARFRLNRAIVHIEDGDRTAALADAAEVVARAPDLAEGWRLRATLHYESGQRDAAIADWQQTVRLAPGDADSLFNLAVALAAAGRPADAGEAADRYLALPARPGGAADAARMRALRAAR